MRTKPLSDSDAQMIRSFAVRRLPTGRIRRQSMQGTLSMWDRTVYGAISSAFGCLLGLGASLCTFLVFHDCPIRWMVLVSAVYFFFVGAVRGPDAGFVMGEALSAVTGAVASETGFVAGIQQNSQQPNSWTSPATLVAWALIMAFVAWRSNAH